jgi:hypothetical protein
MLCRIVVQACWVNERDVTVFLLGPDALGHLLFFLLHRLDNKNDSPPPRTTTIVPTLDSLLLPVEQSHGGRPKERARASEQEHGMGMHK